MPAQATDETQNKIGVKQILTLVLLSLIWGTSFILVKRGLEAYNPLQLASLRICIAGIGFLPFFIFHIRKEKISNTWKYIAVGLTGTAIPAFCFAIAQTKISSSAAGIMNALTPIFTIIIGVLFYQMRVIMLQLLGVIMGLGGAIVLILLGSHYDSSSANMWFAGFVALSSILYAINLNFVKTHFQNENSIRLSAYSFVLVAIPCLIYVVLSDIPSIIKTPEGLTALGYVALLSIFSTMLALIIFYRLVQTTNAVFSSSVSYLVPVVALLWGVVDGEYIGFGHYLSLVLILFAVFLIRRS